MKTETIVSVKESIYQGKYLNFERWNIILPNHQSAIREIVVPHHAVAVVPVDSQQRLHLVRQARPAVNDLLIEIPAGIIDAGETPEITARRELVEEIGYYPRTLKKIVTYYHAEGYSTGIITLFLGTDLEICTDAQPDHEEFIERLTVPFSEALTWVYQGRFKDSKSMLGILLTQGLI